VSAEGVCLTFLVLADINGEGNPDSEEHGPVDEFEGEDEVMVALGTMNHARSEDPKDGEDGPGTLYRSALVRAFQGPGKVGGQYSSNSEADFRPAREDGESISREGHDEDGEHPLGDTHGQGPRGTSDSGIKGHCVDSRG
jgi:hypothetical protein